jgi:hypothetical protein
MIKLIGRRALLLILASMLMGATFGALNSNNAFAQNLEIFYDGYDSGGGGDSWSCPISEVTTGDSVCRSTGCTKKCGDCTYTCVFYNPKGSKNCPPLEQCTNE